MQIYVYSYLHLALCCHILLNILLVYISNVKPQVCVCVFTVVRVGVVLSPKNHNAASDRPLATKSSKQ